LSLQTALELLLLVFLVSAIAAFFIFRKALWMLQVLHIDLIDFMRRDSDSSRDLFLLESWQNQWQLVSWRIKQFFVRKLEENPEFFDLEAAEDLRHWIAAPAAHAHICNVKKTKHTIHITIHINLESQSADIEEEILNVQLPSKTFPDDLWQDAFNLLKIARLLEIKH
jgi:hypothetical protein